MPSKLKKRQRINRNNLNKWELLYLMTGQQWFLSDDVFTDENIKPKWEKYKDLVIELYTDPQTQKEVDEIVIKIAKPVPGKRPYGWWTWEAPEPLKIKEEPCDHYPACCAACEHDYYKSQYKLANYCRHTETQLEYLTRLDLLTESEIELLKNDR